MSQSEKILSVNLDKLYVLLRKTEPSDDEFDIKWKGPYYIHKRHLWCPSGFLLYKSELYAQIKIGWNSIDLQWKPGNTTATSIQNYSFDDDYIWGRSLPQIEKKLEEALKNPKAYNRRVARQIPLTCRTGRIERGYTWKKGKVLLSKPQITKLERALLKSENIPSLPEMTLQKYLNITAIAYDAVLKKNRDLLPIDKYRRYVDRRHGGMLDLPAENAKAFDEWYSGTERQGSHPWEIVYSFDNGILLQVERDKENWRFVIVGIEDWHYPIIARMAIALINAEVPLRLAYPDKVLNAVKGIDLIEVGPYYGQVPLDLLMEERPEVVDKINWDPIPVITPITQEGSNRLAYCDKKGFMSGYNK